ncbi:MAG TPA: hypothetical protein DCE42_01355, partial [Myxococcales bacterium]|nr:hypothetical protein [Myxococcales bacterium]
CRTGIETCRAGKWSSCVGQVLPQTETCNSKDDDCDGKVDEYLTKSCYSGPAGTAGVGICKAGTQSCQAGKLTGCVGEVTPRKEICNKYQDDDCDGQVDEGNICPICPSICTSDTQCSQCGFNTKCRNNKCVYDAKSATGSFGTRCTSSCNGFSCTHLATQTQKGMCTTTCDSLYLCPSLYLNGKVRSRYCNKPTKTSNIKVCLLSCVFDPCPTGFDCVPDHSEPTIKICVPRP